MQQEIRFATFNVRNLALPGVRFYDNAEPYTLAEYEAKIAWIAQQLDMLDADIIGFQEIFSQSALKDVLARTQKYRHAQHAGFDPNPSQEQLTPSVALVSRLPVIAGATEYADFPRALSLPLHGTDEAVTRFTRPVLHVQVALSTGVALNVFVVHLKSKRPDYRHGEHENDPYQLGTAVLRSLIRHGMEALGLRYLLTDFAKGNRVPTLVMGDFNDVAASVPLQLVMGTGRHGKNGFDDRLFDAYRLQLRRPLRDVGYTYIHEGNYEIIDHILVSEEFNPASRYAIGEIVETIYLNSHLALKRPEASDHGMVLVRAKLHGMHRHLAGNGIAI